MKKRVHLSLPEMGGMEIEFVKQAFDDKWVAPLGPNVDAFEAEICAYTGAGYALAMSSGTAAIHMALRCIGVSGGVVFCSSLTFAASCNPIIYENANPVFIDSEPDSWNMSTIALEKAFNKYGKEVKAVIVVNLYGQSADMDKILPICEKYGVPVIEDAAESLGADYKSKMSGTLGRFGVFSFNGNKIITTSGGGMLICPDSESRKRILKWITQSREAAKHYEHKELGFNYRMSNICAGIGRGQLLVLNDRIRRKKEIYETYKAALAGLPVTMMPIKNYGSPNYWLTCLTIDERANLMPGEIIDALEAENIESRPIWKPMHLQPYYKERDYFAHDKDVSADIFKRGLCLPSSVCMTEGDVERVVDIVKKGRFDCMLYG